MTFLEKTNNAWCFDSIRLINSIPNEIKSTFFYIQEIGFFKTEHPYYTERRHLNSFLILYTLSGQGKLIYKEQAYDLKENSLFFIDCMEHHIYYTKQDHPWSFLWIHFNGATSRGYYEHFHQRNSPVITIENSQKVEHYLNTMILMIQKKNHLSDIHASQYIIDLLTYILINSKNESSLNEQLPRHLTELVSHLQNTFNEEHRLSHYAQKFALNPSYLSRQFKKHLRVSFVEYIITLRMNRAKELLKYSEYPIYEIASMVGIDNVTHFINLFKYREELTPLQFRNQWRG